MILILLNYILKIPDEERFRTVLFFTTSVAGMTTNYRKSSEGGIFLWFFCHTRGKLGWRLKTEDWRLKAEGKATRKKARFVPAHQPPSTKAALKTRTTFTCNSLLFASGQPVYILVLKNEPSFPRGRNGGWNHVKIEGCEKRQQKETGQIPQREKRSQEVEKTGKSVKTGHRQWVIGDGTGAISEKWKAMSEGFVMVRQARHDT